MDNENNIRVARLEAQVETIKEDVAELKSDVKEIHSRITTGNREIMAKIDEKIDGLARADTSQHMSLQTDMKTVSRRVEELERWRWMIVGATLVIGFLLGHMDITKLFK
jgi:ElaB/YqjD/DUF883 family membrane-anchored ribosome-binding protein